MRLIYSTVLAALMLAGIVGSAFAHDYKLGSLEIGHPWARAMPQGATVGGGYLTVRNPNGTPDRLLGASSPRAARIELHEVTAEGDVVKMRRVHAVEIAAGAIVELHPGGLHLMFVGVNSPFEEGERFPATLVFDRAGEIEVEFTVEGLGTDAEEPHAH